MFWKWSTLIAGKSSTKLSSTPYIWVLYLSHATFIKAQPKCRQLSVSEANCSYSLLVFNSRMCSKFVKYNQMLLANWIIKHDWSPGTIPEMRSTHWWGQSFWRVHIWFNNHLLGTLLSTFQYFGFLNKFPRCMTSHKYKWLKIPYLLSRFRTHYTAKVIKSHHSV